MRREPARVLDRGNKLNVKLKATRTDRCRGKPYRWD